MATPILATKLFVPPLRPKITPRPRLIAQLNDGLYRKLTLVSAQAGFGKTTIISQWIHGCERPIGWFSIDERDSEPLPFLTYFVAALKTISAEIAPQTTTLLQSQPPPSAELLLTTLLNELAAFPTPFILVLDDYHRITAPAVDDALAFLIDHMPPQMHLVITTREDPQLPLSRLRVRGQMTELREVDLRFTAEEASAFLNQGMGLVLSAENVAALEARTEGWIAGLQLAAIALQTKNHNQGAGDKNAFIENFTGGHHFILDYLVEEVLANQSEDVRDFLLQTAILNRLSSPLCNAVTGKRGSKTLLNHLLRDNLFLIPLDSTRRWFRYHHLFGEVLHTRLLEEQPDRVRHLHQRASEWYMQDGQVADAIRHAYAAKDFELAASQIELAWRSMDRSFQGATWLSWVQELPEEMIPQRPVLCVGYAWALLDTGQIQAAEPLLALAERWLESPSAEMIVVATKELDSLPATIAAGRAYMARAAGDLPSTLKYAQQTLDLLPEDDHFYRGIPAITLGLAQWANGELISAFKSATDAVASFQIAKNARFALAGKFVLAELKVAQGYLNEAAQIYKQSLQQFSEREESLLWTGANLHRGLSMILCEQGDIEASEQQLAQCKALNEQAGIDDTFSLSFVAQAKLKTAQGDIEEALELLGKAQASYRRGLMPNIAPIGARICRLLIARRQLAEAEQWRSELALTVEDELSYLREYEHITLARLRIAEGALDEALGFLGRLAVSAENGSRIGSLIEIQLLQALAHHAQGDKSQAVDLLAKALISAEPQGYMQLFVAEGQPVAEMLTTLQDESDAPQMQAYIQRLLSAFPSRQPIPPPTSEPQPTLVDPLSERELDVLRLLTTDLTGPKIANELMVSLNTFRTHTKNIYSKLAVNNRRAAVRRATELSLL